MTDRWGVSPIYKVTHIRPPAPRTLIFFYLVGPLNANTVRVTRPWHAWLLSAQLDPDATIVLTSPPAPPVTGLSDSPPLAPLYLKPVAPGISNSMLAIVDNCWQLWTIELWTSGNNTEEIQHSSEMPTIANNLREYMVRDVRVGWDLLTYDNNFWQFLIIPNNF